MSTAAERHQSALRRKLAWTVFALACAALILFPVFWMATMMVKPTDIMFARPTVWLFEPTLEHFDYVVERGFHQYLFTSLLLGGISTILVVILGTPAAYAFARFEMRGNDDLFLFILATRMAPPVCMVIPYYLIFARIDLLDTFVGLTLAYMTFNLSFYIWVLRSFCRDLPVELEEAARLEGWSRLQVFRRVVFPLLRNGIIATAMLCFIFAWNEFMFAFMLGGKSVQTLPVAIPTLITTQGVRWGEMAVVGMVALTPVMIAVFLLQRHIVRGLTLGAVKG
jgi:multiple sugar transport system permease protein